MIDMINEYPTDVEAEVAAALNRAAERHEEARRTHSHKAETIQATATPAASISATAFDRAAEPAVDHAAMRRERDARLLHDAQARRESTPEAIDLRFVHQLLTPGALRRTLHGWYRNGRSYLMANLGGMASADETRKRAKTCQDCTLRVMQEVGREQRRSYCRAENGGAGCNCPKHWAWRPGMLSHKVSLAHWQCPIGKFGAVRGRVPRIVLEGLGWCVVACLVWAVVHIVEVSMG